MKTKRQVKIILEKLEITRIQIGRRRESEITFGAADHENQDASSLIENSGGFKARLRKKIREFWKRNRRRF